MTTLVADCSSSRVVRRPSVALALINVSVNRESAFYSHRHKAVSSLEPQKGACRPAAHATPEAPNIQRVLARTSAVKEVCAGGHGRRPSRADATGARKHTAPVPGKGRGGKEGGRCRLRPHPHAEPQAAAGVGAGTTGAPRCASDEAITRWRQPLLEPHGPKRWDAVADSPSMHPTRNASRKWRLFISGIYLWSD